MEFERLSLSLSWRTLTVIRAGSSMPCQDSQGTRAIRMKTLPSCAAYPGPTALAPGLLALALPAPLSRRALEPAHRPTRGKTKLTVLTSIDDVRYFTRISVLTV